MSENQWRARWPRDQIRAMLLEQFNGFWRRDTGTERTQLAELERAMILPHAVIISGLRRAGKSTRPTGTCFRPIQMGTLMLTEAAGVVE